MSKKRPRSDNDGSETSAEKYNLLDTPYAGLQKQVERMIRARKGGDSQDSKPMGGRPSKSPQHNNKKKARRTGEKAGKEAAKDDSSKQESVPQPRKPSPAPSPSPSASSDNPLAQQYTNDHTVYIQGLPFTASEEEVRAFFQEAGTIVSLRLPKWHDSSKLRGYGHVVFSDEEAAQKALEMNGLYLQDRFITVARPLVPRALASTATPQSAGHRPAGCHTIFVKNLPYDITEEEIRKSFMVYGPIDTVRLAVWNHTNNLKGFGYIAFKREESAEIAVKKTGSIVIRDRIISVDYETGAPKAGYKGSQEEQKKKKRKKV
eukprot:gene8674-9557_t